MPTSPSSVSRSLSPGRSHDCRAAASRHANFASARGEAASARPTADCIVPAFPDNCSRRALRMMPAITERCVGRRLPVPHRLGEGGSPGHDPIQAWSAHEARPYGTKTARRLVNMMPSGDPCRSLLAGDSDVTIACKQAPTICVDTAWPDSVAVGGQRIDVPTPRIDCQQRFLLGSHRVEHFRRMQDILTGRATR